MDDQPGFVMGPARIQPWKDGPWLRAAHPAVRLLTRTLWIWRVRIKGWRRYRGVFD